MENQTEEGQIEDYTEDRWRIMQRMKGRAEDHEEKARTKDCKDRQRIVGRKEGQRTMRKIDEEEDGGTVRRQPRTVRQRITLRTDTRSH